MKHLLIILTFLATCLCPLADARSEQDQFIFLLSRKHQDSAAIEGMLDSGLRIDSWPEEKQNPFWRLYADTNLSAAELITISEKMLQAGAKWDADTFGAACRTYKKELIAFWLAQGADVNDDGSSYSTPLTWICLIKQDEHRTQKRECVRYLLEQGAAIHGKGGAGAYATPLNFASVSGDVETMSLLLEHGADVNLAPMEGITPLQDACGRYSNLSAIKLLLQHGANINQRNIFGQTALMLVCVNWQIDTIRYLLAQGADAGAWSPALSEDEFYGHAMPPLPTLAYPFLSHVFKSEEVDFPLATECAWEIFKALSFWEQLLYLLALLLLIALPVALFALLIWLIRRLKKKEITS